MRWDAQRTFPSREAWLAARRIGSSDVAELLGLVEGRLGYRAWRHLQGRPLARRRPSWMDKGRHWEPVLQAAYLAETGRELRKPRAEWCLWDAPEPHSTSTPDGFIRDAGVWGLGETKLAFDMRVRFGPNQPIHGWTASLREVVRPDWVMQCHHQCWALDAPWCDLIVLLPMHELRVYRVHRHPEIERRMVRRLRSWHARHVVEGQPVQPEGSKDEIRELGERFAPRPGERFRPRPALPEEVALARQLAWMRSVDRNADQQIRRLTHQLVARAKRASKLLVGASGAGGAITIVRTDTPYVVLSGDVARTPLRRAA